MNDMKIQGQLEGMLGERDTTSRPVWVRAPKDGGVEHYSSLGKGILYALEAEGVIKSACLKRPGAVRGVRLFHLESILKYIASKTTAPDKT
jgi:hypothetical protein